MNVRYGRLTAVAALTFSALGSSASVAQTNAYITNSGSSTVSVISTGTDTLTATIQVGGNAQG
jgi:YVTN family beta-propeller protein